MYIVDIAGKLVIMPCRSSGDRYNPPNTRNNVQRRRGERLAQSSLSGYTAHEESKTQDGLALVCSPV